MLLMEDSGDGEAMALIDEIGCVRVAEIELIVEVHTARHDVF